MGSTDVEQGGETVFPASRVNSSEVPHWDELSECAQKGLSVRPRMGDALLFWSMKPDATLDSTSLHGGQSDQLLAVQLKFCNIWSCVACKVLFLSLWTSKEWYLFGMFWLCRWLSCHQRHQVVSHEVVACWQVCSAIKCVQIHIWQVCVSLLIFFLLLFTKKILSGTWHALV